MAYVGLVSVRPSLNSESQTVVIKKTQGSAVSEIIYSIWPIHSLDLIIF